MRKDEKVLHRIIAQKKGITLTAETKEDTTFDEAKEIAVNEVLGGVDKLVNFEPIVVLPIADYNKREMG